MHAFILCWLLIAQVSAEPPAPPASQQATEQQDTEATDDSSNAGEDGASDDTDANAEPNSAEPDSTESENSGPENAEPSPEEEIKMADPPEDLEEAVSTVWKSVYGMWESFLGRLPIFILAFIVVVLTWFAAAIGQRLCRRVLRGVHIRGSLKDLIRQFVYIGIWLSGMMIAAIIIFPSLKITTMLSVLGLSSIAVGFAFKDIVENFFAGILILWGFPYETGDFIECNGIKGKVEETTIRMTTIRQVDGQLIVVPNAQLFKNPVYVMTSQRFRRTTIIVGVAYDEDVDKCRDIITQAVESCETVTDEKPIQVFAQEFGASSINYEVTWWAGSTPVAERKSRDEVVAAVKRALDDAGVEIPFPYRTLTFKEPLPILQNQPSKPEA
ncbi:mechanosensitive ion channel family protein [Adhaeretor mobilis]|uniref:Small-conductance mechanosensitive channel n=1 Tax=Adhaeretor mobilis TaxID=1930276 RepID=A0A517N311_9BACT|nr:mechanosensitive ion channel family protein [Adhaeretor mobilis]QDT01531.1 Small-conductance mechanosensitive channel [Adhaeretor mobilis]